MQRAAMRSSPVGGEAEAAAAAEAPGASAPRQQWQHRAPRLPRSRPRYRSFRQQLVCPASKCVQRSAQEPAVGALQQQEYPPSMARHAKVSCQAVKRRPVASSLNVIVTILCVQIHVLTREQRTEADALLAEPAQCPARL